METVTTKTLLIADLNNIFYGLRTLKGPNWRINYNRLITLIKDSETDCITPIAYLRNVELATSKDYKTNEGKICRSLSKAGFIVKTTSQDNNQQTNVDFSIIQSLQDHATTVDKIALFSGKAIFGNVLKTLLLINPKLQVWVCSFKHTLSKQLANQATRIITLDEYIDSKLAYMMPLRTPEQPATVESSEDLALEIVE